MASPSASHSGDSVEETPNPLVRSSRYHSISTDGIRSAPMISGSSWSISCWVWPGSMRMSSSSTAVSGTVLSFSPLWILLGLIVMWLHECRLLANAGGSAANASLMWAGSSNCFWMSGSSPRAPTRAANTSSSRGASSAVAIRRTISDALMSALSVA